VSDARAVVSGLGLACAVGPDAPRACAALRAGIARALLSDVPFCAGPNERDEREPAPLAPARGVPAGAAGVERLLALAAPALAEAVRTARLSRADFARAALHVALPGGDRPGAVGWETAFPDALIARAGAPRPASVDVARGGPSGFGEALSAAVARIAADRTALAIIVCADSLIDRTLLEWLEANDRLKCTRSPEGVIPGEAAAAFVVEHAAALARREARVRATIEAVALDRDAATLASGRPWTGDGLARAIGAAAAAAGAPLAPAWVLTDHNGERHRAQDFGYAVSRRHAVLGELRHIWYAADSLGDTGAAAGGVLAARAALAFERGYAPSPRALVVLSSDDGGRAAVVLGAPPAPAAEPASAARAVAASRASGAA
jgi:3-oxoacyl-[acyl-carrier-protein] synthase-1